MLVNGSLRNSFLMHINHGIIECFGTKVKCKNDSDSKRKFEKKTVFFLDETNSGAKKLEWNGKFCH